nr:ethylene-responsive transcription factor 3-like [Aegilops tauschii subsp. strangulata]
MASARPSSGFFAEIRFREMRLGLGTFDTAHEAARAYDTVAWHLWRPRREMNFPNVPTREQAQELAPPPRLITDEDRRDNRRREMPRRTRKPRRGGANASCSTSSMSTSEEDISEAESDDEE